MYQPRLGNQVANQPHYPPQQQQRQSQFLPIQQENFISNRNYNQNGNFEMMNNFNGRGLGEGGGLSSYPIQNDFRNSNGQFEMDYFDDHGGGGRGNPSNYNRQNGFSNITQNDEIEMDNFNVGFRGNGRGIRGRGRGDRGHHRWSPPRENVPRPYENNLPPFVNPNYVLRPMPNQQPIVEHSVNRNFDHNSRGTNQDYRGSRGAGGRTIGGNFFRNHRGNQPNQGHRGNFLSSTNRRNSFNSYNSNHQNLNSHQGYDISNTFSTLEADPPSGNAFDEEDLVRPNMVNAYGVPFSSGRNYGSQPVLMSNGNYENYRNYRNNNNGFVPIYPEAQFTGGAEMANRNFRTLQDSDPTTNRNEPTVISICHLETNAFTGGEIVQTIITQNDEQAQSTLSNSNQTDQIEQNVHSSNQNPNLVFESRVVADNDLELVRNQFDLQSPNSTFANPNQNNCLPNYFSTSEQTVPKVIDAAAITRPNLVANGPSQPLVPPTLVLDDQDYFRRIQRSHQPVVIQPNTNIVYYLYDINGYPVNYGCPQYDYVPAFGPFLSIAFPTGNSNPFNNIRGQPPNPSGIPIPRATCARCGRVESSGTCGCGYND